ncbi:MAG: hypothetical protein FVQ85_12470 [Planctomycetes bacterium]|nr:hypothetical protein [Planctomycetota bacterium]
MKRRAKYERGCVVVLTMGKRTMDESGIRSSTRHTADRENKSGEVIMIAGAALGYYNANELLVEIS